MRTRTPNRVAPVAGCGLLAWVALAVMSCVPPSSGVPLDRPVYPTGLAVHPGGERLVVVSSAFDLAYDDGTPRCGTSPQALQVPESDPFDVLVLDEATEDGVLTRVDTSRRSPPLVSVGLSPNGGRRAALT